ncbi:hypothetical protein pdam_00017817 [Pocillopora damicornis]|uniref:Uncharacterized protein n=1 Tax=Pocillopora damicornis TaxID=46731 RepID=A0A3M6TYV1_POCDA|nr:hypothetical protein pdam_00017817 [Pocillopora damicornis]
MEHLYPTERAIGIDFIYSQTITGKVEQTIVYNRPYDRNYKDHDYLVIFALFPERMQILYFSGSTPELLNHRTTFLYVYSPFRYQSPSILKSTACMVKSTVLASKADGTTVDQFRDGSWIVIARLMSERGLLEKEYIRNKPEPCISNISQKTNQANRYLENSDTHNTAMN